MLLCLHVAFDSILNAVWVSLGLMALAVTLRFTLDRGSVLARRRIWQSCAVTALIAATLFPVVSATDDILRIEHLEKQQQTKNSRNRQPAQKSVPDNLIRLFESMDMPLIAVMARMLLTLLFICFVGALLASGIERSNPYASGRSPPFAPIFA